MAVLDLKEVNAQLLNMASDKEMSAEKIESFIKKHPGINVNARLEKFLEGYTPLHLACMVGNLEVCRVLIQYGADLHAADKHGATPLVEAMKGKNSAIAELIIETDPTVLKDQGAKALEKAVTKGCTSMVKLFLEKGVTGDNKKLLSIAAQNGSADIVDLLVAYGAEVGADPDLLVDAAIGGLVNLCGTLLDNGVPVNFRTKLGYTALWWAKEKKREEVCELLTEYGGVDTVEELKSPLDTWQFKVLMFAFKLYNAYKQCTDKCRGKRPVKAHIDHLNFINFLLPWLGVEKP